MRRFTILGILALALSLFPALAMADWEDDFDSYAPGSGIAGQGEWAPWDPGGGDALVSDLYSLSPTNSLEATGLTDMVHQYSGYATGVWTYTAWIYIPAGYSGQSYFILMNNYDAPGHVNSVWTVQMYFDSATGLIKGNYGSSTEISGPAFVEDQWAKIQVDIDLDEDWTQVYYNGTLIYDPSVAQHPQLGYGYSWTKGIFGTGAGLLNIAAVDLFANSASPVYYDDLSLHPASLAADTHVIPETTGGKANFSLYAGTANANRGYLIIGGVTGTSPGIPLPGGKVTLPINFDIFSQIVIMLANTPIFANFLGNLDAQGTATATFDTLGPVSGATGVIVNFAYTLAPPYNFVSRAVPVQIVP